MFKKLKAKIEEGGENGIENVSFSEKKLPGSAVRASSSTTASSPPLQPVLSRSPSPLESRDHHEDEGVAVPPVNYERNLSVNSVC